MATEAKVVVRGEAIHVPQPVQPGTFEAIEEGNVSVPKHENT